MRSCLGTHESETKRQLRLLSKGNGDWVARRVAGGETHASGELGTKQSKDEAFGGRPQTTNQNHLETSTKQSRGRMGVGRLEDGSNFCVEDLSHLKELVLWWIT